MAIPAVQLQGEEDMTEDYITERAPNPVSDTAKKIEAGDTAWTEQGQRVTVIDLTVSGAYLVAPMIEYGGSYDEPPTCEMGDLQIMELLYPEPPRPLLDEQMAKVRAEIDEASKCLQNIRAETREATAERTRLLDKLKQVPALQNIEAAIEQRFTHIITRSYGPPYQIGKIEEVLASDDRYNKGLKLLSLYGDAKGDLQWRISHYSDGSGGSSDAWPFTSEEGALAFLRKQIAEDITLHSGKHQDARPYYLVALCKQAREIGVAIPEQVLAMEKTEARKIADHALSEARKDAQRTQLRLAQAEAERAAIDAPAPPAPLAPMPGPDGGAIDF